MIFSQAFAFKNSTKKQSDNHNKTKLLKKRRITKPKELINSKYIVK